MANTKNTIIAERYSQALADLAQDGKLSYEKISADLNLISDILKNSKDLREFLVNPLVSEDDKKEVINKVFSSDIDALTVNFLKVLVDKNRFNVFDDVLSAFNATIDDVNNISRVNVTSVIELSDDVQKRLREKLESRMNKKVVLDLNIDTDIIAGLVLKIGDNVIDMSLKHKLEDLSRCITK